MAHHITLFAPERLYTLIEEETKAGRRAELAEALLRLIQLHTGYMCDPTRPDTVGSIMLLERNPGDTIREIAWGIQRDVKPNGYGGTTGTHVLNGGLIQHADFKWEVHT